MSPADHELRSGRGRVPALAAWAALLVLGLLGWVPLLGGPEAPRAWRGLLAGFLFFTPLAAGMTTWPAILLASQARWAGGIEIGARRGMAFALPSLAALAALWAGSGAWAPWRGKALHQGAWLDNDVLFARDFVVLAAFWALARWALGRRRAGERGAPEVTVIVAYCVAFTLIGMDLAMALDPRWSSTLFGGYFFISGLYAAVTALALGEALRAGTDRDRLHDLGKLVLAFSLLTTYMMFSQLLPIWYENLPHETTYVAPRRNVVPWSYVSAVLIGLVYLGPLVLLLRRRAKRSPRYLGAVSLLLLAGLWIERWWLVAPAFSTRIELGVAELAAAAVLAGAFGLAAGLAGPRTAMPGSQAGG